MRSKLGRTIPTLSLILALAFICAGCVQTRESRRAAAGQRAQEGLRQLTDELAKAEAEAARIRAARAKLPRDPGAAQRAAEAAAKARQVWLAREIIPWLHPDRRLPDGSAPSLKDQRAREAFQSRIIAQQLAAKANLDRRTVAEYVGRQRLPAFTELPDGRVSLIVGIENGIPRAQVPCNLEAADTVSTDELWPGGSTGLGLTGINVVMGLWDVGNVREHAELDFYLPSGARVTDMDGYFGYSPHSTHVAGTLIASGECSDCLPPEDSPFARGMAFRGHLLAWDFENDYAEMAGAAVTNQLRVSNHSYALQMGWGFLGNLSIWFGDLAISTTEDYHFGFYSTDTQTLDQIANAAPTYLPVWAAANERSKSPGTGRPLTPPEQGYLTTSNTIPIISYDPRPDDGDPGGYDTLSQQASAKNVLTVGAVHPITNGYAGPGSVLMTDFSSFGPTDDGRVKPDLVADGFNVFSLGNDNGSYATLSGTSMAAPSVCGSLGLLLELHDRFHGTNQPMLASTLKGLAIHTADEAGDHPGPDYRFGWGLLNTRAAALLMQSNYASGSLAHIKEVRLSGGDFIEFPVVSAGTQALVVSVQWNDPAGTPPPASLDPTNRMLVNDLDLRLIGPTGATNFPWVLNPVARTNAATTGDNTRDNVEQVALTNPCPATYLVRVTHKGTNLVTGTSGATNEQWVSIFVSGNTPQTAPALAITSITALSSNVVSVRWPSVVGRVYQVQHRDDGANGSWSASTGEISATKTNLAVNLSLPTGATRRFFRVAQLR